MANKRGSRTFTTEQQSYIREIYKNRFNYEIADLLNKKFGTSFTESQVKGFKKRNRLRSEKRHTPPTAFKKGNKPMAPFKKGGISHMTAPIGSIRSRKHKGNYVTYIKVSNTGNRGVDWKRYSHYLWEKEYGKIPEGYKLIIKNGDGRDIRLDNLMLVSGKVHIRMSTNFKYSTYPDITEVEVLNQEIKVKLKELENEV